MSRAPDVADLEQAIADRAGDGPRGLPRRPADRRGTPRQPPARQRGAHRRRVPGGRAAAVARARSSRPSEGSGTSADSNREAFAWGRWVVHDRAAVDAALAEAAQRQGGSEHLRPVARRAGGRARNWSRTATCPTRCGSSSPGAPRRWSTTRAAHAAARYLDLVERVAARDDADHELGAHRRGRRGVVQAPHLQGRVRGRPPAPEDGLRPGRRASSGSRGRTRSSTNSTRRCCAAWA